MGAPGTAAGPLVRLSQPPGAHLYGSEADVVAGLPGADHALAPGLTEAMVRFAARHEYARTVEDVLARRSRLLFLDAAEAARAAPAAAAVLSSELGTGHDTALPAFQALAESYIQHGLSAPA